MGRSIAGPPAVLVVAAVPSIRCVLVAVLPAVKDKHTPNPQGVDAL